jgi:hypothetical protein
MPVVGLAASVTIGASITWVALFVAHYTPYPIEFNLTTAGFGSYAAVAVSRNWWAAMSTFSGPGVMGLFGSSFLWTQRWLRVGFGRRRRPVLRCGDSRDE